MTRTDPNSPQTFEKAPDGPQGRPEGDSTALASPKASNGPQAGADGLASWSQLEAHAFNAVQPALQAAGAWLPMSVRRTVARAVLAAVQPHLAGHYQHAVDATVAAKQRAEQAEKRLRLAHQARRGKEQQLDDVCRALCDIGFMEDGDPYSHADLADVIRQNGQALLDAPAHNAGPSVREAAAQDRRYWERKDAGEQL